MISNPITMLIKLPAEKILNFVINLDFLSCFSSGSTNAPGKIANNKRPTSLNFIFSALAIIPWKASCGIRIIEITIICNTSNHALFIVLIINKAWYTSKLFYLQYL